MCGVMLRAPARHRWARAAGLRGVRAPRPWRVLPWDSPGHHEVPGGRLGKAWAQIGGGGSQSSSYCGDSGHCPGGKGPLWGRAGTALGSQVVCAFLHHPYKYYCGGSHRRKLSSPRVRIETAAALPSEWTLVSASASGLN